jgi:hypothetical protein
MSGLPLPIRLAAGLAAIALERARKLPQDVSEWPMTAVSQALQISMRLQQRITELAIKGDEVLAALREAEENPPWAVFDEDVPTPVTLMSTEAQDEDAPVALTSTGTGDEDVPVTLASTDTEDEDAAVTPVVPADGYADDGPAPVTVLPTNGQEQSPTEVDGRQVDEPPGEELSWYKGVNEIFDNYTGDVAASTETAVPTDQATGPAALPNYPELSLPSVRGRLRRLTEPDLRQLLEYERTHDARPDFVRMLTNRLASVRNR